MLVGVVALLPLSALRIAAVGDSLTYGTQADLKSPTNYPAVLSAMLGENVTNLGVGMITLQHNGSADAYDPHAFPERGNGSYWDTPQFAQLSGQTWDIVIIMVRCHHGLLCYLPSLVDRGVLCRMRQLGTNDAKRYNWPYGACGDPETSDECPFVQAYADLIAYIRTLGSPEVFVCIPPPVTLDGAFGIDAHVHNFLLPAMISRVAADNDLDASHVVNLFGALGGYDLPPVGPAKISAVLDQYGPCYGWWDEPAHSAIRSTVCYYSCNASGAHRHFSCSVGACLEQPVATRFVDCDPATCAQCDGNHFLDSGYQRMGKEVYDTLTMALGGEDGLLAPARSGRVANGALVPFGAVRGYRRG
jgi:hypothetical protein